MPKVSEEHKERRREQILEGARRCFARYGYEGATVARLEQEIGPLARRDLQLLPNKDALFIELAIEMSKRLTDVWLQRAASAPCSTRSSARIPTGWRCSSRRRGGSVPTPSSGELIEQRERSSKDTRAERLEQVRPQVREDVPLEDAAVFLSFVANGLALRQAMGDPLPDLDVIAKLVDEGVAPR